MDEPAWRRRLRAFLSRSIVGMGTKDSPGPNDRAYDPAVHRILRGLDAEEIGELLDPESGEAELASASGAPPRNAWFGYWHERLVRLARAQHAADAAMIRALAKAAEARWSTEAQIVFGGRAWDPTQVDRTVMLEDRKYGCVTVQLSADARALGVCFDRDLGPGKDEAAT